MSGVPDKFTFRLNIILIFNFNKNILFWHDDVKSIYITNILICMHSFYLSDTGYQEQYNLFQFFFFFFRSSSSLQICNSYKGDWIRGLQFIINIVLSKLFLILDEGNYFLRYFLLFDCSFEDRSLE